MACQWQKRRCSCAFHAVVVYSSWVTRPLLLLCLLWGDFPAECGVRRAVYHIRPQTLPHRNLGIMTAFALFCSFRCEALMGSS